MCVCSTIYYIMTVAHNIIMTVIICSTVLSWNELLLQSCTTIWSGSLRSQWSRRVLYSLVAMGLTLEEMRVGSVQGYVILKPCSDHLQQSYMCTAAEAPYSMRVPTIMGRCRRIAWKSKQDLILVTPLLASL